ncbi:MAG: peptidoglycan DD-metalloendopeptidase family protein [Candidatus Kerfeldbacteria bacterium]|nr:peptidoglycan DD-metalloendopeptidase family protein [Candidatus Kerfeldbacteria bacterium]
MKRLLIFLVAGMLMIPVAGWAQQVADSFQLPLSNYPINDRCLSFGGLNSGFQLCGKDGKHTGDDACEPIDTPVYAVANGRVKLAGTHYTCPNWEYIIVIEHTLTNGSIVCSVYGHCPPEAGISAGVNVTKGQRIAHVTHLTCWPDHLHFAMHLGAYGGSEGVYQGWINGYMPDSTTCTAYPTAWPGEYVDPVVFVQSHETPAYHCNYVNQWVNGVDINEATGTPGTTFTLAVAYKNTGTATWNNVGWISGRQRVVSCTPASVATNATATFTFQAQIPSSMTVGDYQVYFRPFHGTTGMDDWGGLYWLIHVTSPGDVTPPTVPTNLSVNPTGCSETNSFTFSWTASTDAGRSGLAGYEWQINGGTITQQTATSVTTTAPYTGNHTFSVRAYDNAGNRSSYVPIGFCYQPPTGPCPGREIPHTCVGSSTCYPASAANLQMLGTHTAAQWQTVGEPVHELLQAGKTYSVGFEYRSKTATDIKLGLGGSAWNLSSPGLIVGQSSLPAAPEVWHPFWSAPFTVTTEQLKDVSNLRLIIAKNSDEGVEFRNVRILAYSVH